MGRRRMLGRVGGGSGFRYLHDEVSGGTIALSKILCKSTYTGDCINVFSNGDIPYIDNVFSQSEGFSSGYIPIYYNQVGSENGKGDSMTVGFDGATQDFSTAAISMISNSGVYPDNTTDPFTLIITCENYDDTDAGFLRWGNDIAPGRCSMELRRISGNMTFRIRTQPSNEDYRVTFLGFPTWGIGTTKILVLTYDGSLSASGYQLFVNDMTTPLTKTIVSNDPIQSDSFNSGKRSFSRFNTVGSTKWGDIHMFDNDLNQSQRETAKEILEQYYTFS